MAKAFSVASWNVEHFKGKPERVTRVVDFLKESDPDVFALYEVEGSEVFQALTTSMPGYNFHITEGLQVQEILVGVKTGITSFFTQKIEFRGGVAPLRPGSLVTIRVKDAYYPLLFLHTKSGSDPRGLGLRDDMLRRACKFRRPLDIASGGVGKANYIFMGDLNTMGMTYTHVRSEDIEPENELKRLSRFARYRKMHLLDKDEPDTWWNGGKTYPPANLDQVVAADHLRFTSFGAAPVTVKGWPKMAAEADKLAWINDYSDHAMLYFEVQQV